MRLVKHISAVVVAAAGLAGSASGAVTPVATLSGSPSWTWGTQLVADGSTAVLRVGQPDAAVFVRGANGWQDESAPAALLTSANPAIGDNPAISGDTITLDLADGREAVYVKPSGGWNGELSPSATLADSGGERLYGSAIAGDTIVAGVITSKGASWLDVFARPAHGWNGPLTEVARLRDSDRASLGANDAAASDGAVFDPASDRGDVFVRPEGGWRGVQHETAHLIDGSGALSVSGENVLSAGFGGGAIYRRPKRGWIGDVRPSASVRQPIDAANNGSHAISASTVALSTTTLGSEHACPCGGTISLFSRPAAGWVGAFLSAPQLSPGSSTGSLPIALDGNNLLTTDGSVINVYSLRGKFGTRLAAPRITRQAISGLRNNRPMLIISVRTPPKYSGLDQLSLTLPDGLTPVAARQLKRAMTVTGTYTFAVSVKQNTILVQLPADPSDVSVRIRSGGLHASRRLVQRVQARGRHGSSSRAPIRLRASARLTGIWGVTTPGTLTFSVN